MNQITNFLINEGGIERDILILLLFLPVISTIIGIARYYIGIKTFSLYVPILLSASFYMIKINHVGDNTQQILAGLVWGVILTSIVIIVTIITDRFLKVRMHYFPKISLNLSLSIIILILSLTLFGYFDLLNLKDLDITSIILIALVTERFITTLSKKRLKSSLKLSLETILLSVFCYLLMVIEPVNNFILNNPVVILLTLPISYFVGKYTGLRLTEFKRFQDILTEDEEQE